MLENWRYNQAIHASCKQEEKDSQQIFLDEAYRTQLALQQLGIKESTHPSDVPHTGTILMAPELVENLRVPYAVEVLGMPHAGKSTLINRYLKELWSRKERHKVALVEEGARTVKNQYRDLRYSNPFQYALLGGMSTFTSYINSLKNINSGMKMIISDRGQIDRRVFRRALFSRGDVNPKIMLDEKDFAYRLENTPVQIGGVIMLMIRREESMKRSKTVGPVTNTDSLLRLYEQYWRLHQEIIEGEIPFRIYTCIDAEGNKEDVYKRFKYAMDSALNIHNTYLAALARAFPKEFDRAMAQHNGLRGQKKSNVAREILEKKLGGKKVLIVGGDDMKSEEQILKRPFIEYMKLK